MTNQTGFNTSILAGELYRVIPTLYQGIDDYQRVGDKITPIKTNVSFEFQFSQAAEIGLDLTVHLFMLRSKQIKDWDFRDSIPVSTALLDNGQGAGTAFDGTTALAQYPPYKKLFSVLHHRSFRMVKGTGIMNGTPVPPAIGLTSPAQSYHRLNLSVKVPKLTYAKAAATTPDNDCPVWVCGFVRNDSGTFNNFITPLLVTARSHMWFKDA
jgi:hypothetical protein